MFTSIYNRFRRITTNQLYFPEIDGIRFLAIMLVILFHIHGYFAGKTAMKFIDDTDSYHVLNTFLINGDRGVELFFVLSGFILCLPFAHHYINKGKKVSLKKYYLRRVTRLEPPYFIAMTVILLLQLGIKIHPASELWPSWLASLGYLHDIIYHKVPMLTVVAWSLEIEIQFYLLAPIFFSLLALDKVWRRTILCVASIILIYLQAVAPLPFLSIYGFAQYFFVGILLADLYVSDVGASFFNKPWIAAVALALFIFIMYLPVKDKLQQHITFYAAVCLPFAIGLLYYAILKNDILKSIFGYKFVPIIGGMCYSIYLLHYTIISMVGRFTLSIHMTDYYLPNLFLQTILLFIPILIVSSVYYYYIERPFMSRKWMDMLLKKDKKAEDTNTVS